MTVLNGLGNGVQFISGNPGVTDRAMPATATAAGPTTQVPSVIDGTPVRVVVLAISAAVGLMALHTAGFRFNVAVSA